MSDRIIEPPLPDELESVYDLECCNCGEKMGVNPSMMMQMFGINSGSGRCLNDKCKLFMHLWVEDGVMKSEPHDDFVARMREEMQ